MKNHKMYLVTVDVAEEKKPVGQSTYLSCLPLQEGHFGQHAVAITGLRVQVITHSTIQVGCFFQMLMGLIQQT